VRDLASRLSRLMIAALVAVVTVLGVAAAAMSPAEAVTAPAAPASSRSYYMTSATGAYTLGCNLGTQDNNLGGTQHHVAVLDFGAMTLSGSSWTFSAFSGAAMTPAQVAGAAEQFGRGYWVCTNGDISSTAIVAIGTNNSGGTITTAAGSTMGTTAVTLDNWLSANTGQTYGAGANDLESFGFTSSMNAAVKAWVNGYNATNQTLAMYNFGAADGCPSTTPPAATSCNAGLQAETIWYVSWYGSDFPLPEIYNTKGTNAGQWRFLDHYSVTAHGGKMDFTGVTTQWHACGSPAAPALGSACNKPGDGFKQLYEALNNDSVTTDTSLMVTDF